MRRSLVLVLTAGLAAGSAAAEDAPASLSISADGPALTVPALSPLEGPRVVPNAASLHVVSTGAPWSLSVRAATELREPGGAGRELPVSRLSVGIHGSAERVGLSTSAQVLLHEQPVTPGSGRAVAVDYALEARWGDAGGTGYQTQLVYLVSAGTVDGSFVTPSPFSPDGDGSSDVATLHHWLPAAATVGARIIDDANGAVRTLVGPTALSAGEQTFSWDGLADGGGPAPAGRYRFLLEDEGGLVLASAEVQLQLGASSGTAAVEGTVQAAGGAIAGATVTLLRSSGIVQGSATTGDAGGFAVEGVGAGIYRLRVERPLYLPYTGPLFDVAAGVRVRRDVELVHNHSLVIALTATPHRVEIGDLVVLEATARAVGTTAVEDVRLALSLPDGLAPVQGSLRVGSRREQGDASAVPLGRLEPGQLRRVRLLASVRVAAGPLLVSARVSGTALGEPTAAGPAQVRLSRSGSELSGLGGLLGRVCFDVDGDGVCGDDEPPARRAAVFLEEGSWAEADGEGLYHLAPLRPGRHVLLAGPGPVARPTRSGAFPKLPRRGTGRAEVWLPAGQYVPQDLALPVPEGFVAEPAPTEDEGDVLAPPSPRLALASRTVAADEGGMDEAGRLVGLTERIPVPRAPAPPGPLPPQPSPPAPPRAGAPGTEPELDEPEPATALVGVGELTLSVGRGVESVRGDGHLAFTLQHDFAEETRLTLVADSGRNRDELALAAADPRRGYRELGDDAQVAMSGQEALYLRIDAPIGWAQAGRMSVGLGDSELLYSEQSYLGLELGAGDPAAGRLRAFVGVAPELELTDVIPGRDSTGPYQLSLAPVLPGSEAVDLELRTPAGELRQRVRLVRGQDYVLDTERGELFLGTPLPSRSPLGDESVLVVRYQAITAEASLDALVAGAQLVLRDRDRDRRLGVTVLHEGRGAGAHTTAVVDGTGRLGPVAAGAALGTELDPSVTSAPLPRSAGRLRLTAELLEDVELFGAGAFTGEAWGGEVRSRGVAAAVPTPFELLDAARADSSLSLPILSLALSDDRPFPLALPDGRDVVEASAGARVEAGGVTAVTLARRSWERTSPENVRHGGEVAASAKLGEESRVYAAHVEQAGVALGPDDPRPVDRRSLLGGRTRLGDLDGELDLQHGEVDSGATPARVHDGVVLKLRLDTLRALQPAASAGLSLLRRGDERGTERPIALGLESEPVTGVRGFVYGQHVDASGALGQERQGVFAGLQLARASSRAVVRWDLRAADEEVEQNLSWDALHRFPGGLGLGTDGHLRPGDGPEDRFLRLSASLRPGRLVTLLARAEEELLEAGDIRTRTRLAGADLGLRPGRRLELWTKGLVREQRLEDHPDGAPAFSATSVAGLAALRVVLGLGAGWDTAAGVRGLVDGLGTATGGTVEAGRTFEGTVRLALGLNVASREEVFTIEDRAPGFFVSISAGNAGAIGAGTASGGRAAP